ncbi:serine hydrolase domain-containing protein [Terrimonas alba]|uniref:serine hydrolase domain-containing protein n=1 Tax=Terrimonas alba TaxID=3349636 RepID=UPI0035F3ED1C
MNQRLRFIPFLLLLVLWTVQLSAQTSVLPRSIPEDQGVSSKGIIDFLDAMDKSKHEMHSLMILRHGNMIAEGWWSPYRPELKHTLYSLSKSFTSTAVGFAVQEKLLTVNDKVISFFPDKLPGKVNDYLAALSVKDLLSMSAGQAPDPTGPIITKETDWIKGFFATPIVYQPGSVFLYNSAATYMLSAIVQKLTGQKIVDYLQPRLFGPLGIQGVDWETDPMGINTGGWGLRVKTEDIARFGQLYLQKGKWNDKQILPAAWIEEATSFKVDNAPDASQGRRDSSDWAQGYCYQFWRSRNNSYRGDGAFGQYMLVLPEEDAVIAITSETNDMQGQLDLVWKYLLPAMRVDKSTLDKKNAAILKKRLSILKLPLPLAADSAFVTPVISGKQFKIEPNPKQVAQIGFTEKDHVITLGLTTEKDSYLLKFGKGKWIEGITDLLGPSLVAGAKGHFAGLPPSQIAGSYSWKSASLLEMQLRYIDSPHTLIMIFHFEGDKVLVDMKDSFAAPDKKVTLVGKQGQ